MRFKIRNALIAGILYIYVLLLAGSLAPPLALVIALYAAITMVLARALIKSAESRRSSDTIEFSQTGAADSIGTQFGSFHHVYYSHEAVNDALLTALGAAFRSKLGCREFRQVTFKDVDADLGQPEKRTFALVAAPETSRKSESTLMCSFARTANVQSIRWWILVSGRRDPNKVFWRYVLAPVSIPFVVWPYIKRRYDPLNGLVTVHPGFFNGIDVLNRAREIQFVAFETLVEVLNSFGIDTADLKQQKGNVLNVNVSGGQASFGSVVQGAMNRVVGAVGGTKS